MGHRSTEQRPRAVASFPILSVTFDLTALRERRIPNASKALTKITVCNLPETGRNRWRSYRCRSKVLVLPVQT